MKRDIYELNESLMTLRAKSLPLYCLPDVYFVFSIMVFYSDRDLGTKKEGTKLTVVLTVDR